jgi:hypothetical protein
VLFLLSITSDNCQNYLIEFSYLHSRRRKGGRGGCPLRPACASQYHFSNLSASMLAMNQLQASIEIDKSSLSTEALMNVEGDEQLDGIFDMPEGQGNGGERQKYVQDAPVADNMAVGLFKL